MPRISLHNASVLSSEVPAAPILHPLSLELTEDRIAVIGANGSGKSTFLRLLNGLARPDSGTVTVNGLDTARLRKIFAELPQQVIYTTHDLDFAADATRVLVIDGGRIVHDGAPGAALAAYRALALGVQ